jgi:hypothetical protein
MRMLGWVMVVAIAASVSCVSHAAEQRYKQRVDELDALYWAGEAEIEAAFKTESREVKRLRTALVTVRANSHMTPIEPVRANPELQRVANECRGLEESQDLSAVQCWTRWNRDFVNGLIAVYWAADLDWVVSAMKVAPQNADFEALFVYSHNLRLRAHVDAQLETVLAQRIDALEKLARAYNAAKASAAQLRDIEIAEARREFAAGIAIVAQSMSRSSRQTQQGAYESSTSARSQPGCTSDFSCGIGHTCVKANYSGTGYCAKAVNEYGVQTYELPDMDSVFVKMPKDSDCTSAGGCPAGFRCEIRSGACLR